MPDVGTQIFVQTQEGEIQQAPVQATPVSLTSTQKPDFKFAILADDRSNILLCWNSDPFNKIELYEIWKREIVKTNDFIRIAVVFASVAQQNAVTKYKEQLSTLDLDVTQVCAFSDLGITDTIFEYKIRGVRYPTAEDWNLASLANIANFGLGTDILASIAAQSKSSGASPLDILSLNLFGDGSFGWMIGVLNPSVNYFASNETVMGQLSGLVELLIPSEIVDFTNEIKKGISSYSICTIIEKLARSLGKIDDNVLQLLLNIIDKNRIISNKDLSLLRPSIAQDVLTVDASVILANKDKTPPPPPPSGGGGGGEEKEESKIEEVKTNIVSESIFNTKDIKESAVDATSMEGLSKVFSAVRSTMLSKSVESIDSNKQKVQTINIKTVIPVVQESKEVEFKKTSGTVLNADLIKKKETTKKIVRK